MTCVLILAGRRDGALDLLASEAGVSHKCLVPIAGRPLIDHVLGAALALPGLDRVLISTDDPEGLRAVPAIRQAEEQGRLRMVAACPNLADSILAAGAVAGFPMVVTTADNVLLQPDALADFCARAGRDGKAAAVAFARRQAVLAAHPEGQRRFYTFADGAFSNCNLYWLRDAAALSAARAFAGGGQFAKHPVRIAAAFGLLNLLLFRLGRLRLGTMMARLSRVVGVSVQAIEMTDGRLAIDVDNVRTHRIAAELLTKDARMAA